MAPPKITGLILFISDVRECTSEEAIHVRIMKEISKIKQKLVQTKTLSGYERKKAVWKLLFCYLMGYDVEFGYVEVIHLMSSNKYSEKNTGYIAGSLFFPQNAEFFTLAVNSMKIDISSQNDNFAALALNTFTFIATSEMSENLLGTISSLTQQSVYGKRYLKKKAFMCILRILRKDPDLIDVEAWRPRLIQTFIQEVDISCLMAITNLIVAFLEVDTSEWEPIIPRVVALLEKCMNEELQQQYVYYGVPSPWFQIKLLRVLQFLQPPENLDVVVGVNEIIRKCVNKYPSLQSQTPAELIPAGKPIKSKKKKQKFMEIVNRYNVGFAVLFEAINVGIHYENALDLSVKEMIAMKLGGLLALKKEANIRYIGLDAMARMAYDPVAVDSLKTYTQQIIAQLNEPDISIKRQALNLLYGLCDKDNWAHIVNELLNILKQANDQMQEELVLKIAILVEKNAPDLSWYVDAVFKMFEYAPAYVADDVWYRVAQVVTGFSEDSIPDDLQEYAVQKAFDYLAVDFVPEPVVKVGAYLLGEFGHQISQEVSGVDVLNALKHHFPMMSAITQGMILVAYAKLANVFPELLEEVLQLLEDLDVHQDVDLQTRACELAALLQLDSESVSKTLGMMPTYSSAVQSNNPLIARLKQSAKSRAQSRVELEDAANTTGGLLKQSLIIEEKEEENDDEAQEDGEDEGKGEAEDDADGQAEETRSDEEESFDSIVNTLVQSGDNESNEMKIWKSLCLQPKGVLYASSVLSILIDQKYKEYNASYTFSFSNVHRSAVIKTINLQLESNDKVRTKLEKTSVDDIAPGDKADVRAAFQLVAPPKEILSLLVSATAESGGRAQTINLKLRLPLILTKFCVPYEIKADAFKTLWESTGTQNEQKFSGNLKIPLKNVITIMTKSFNFVALPMGSVMGFVSVLKAAPPPEGGSTRSVPVLCVLKESNNQGMFMVRSAAAVVAELFKTQLRMYLLS